jgi:selenocysteine lyase/cysteine desulfurase
MPDARDNATALELARDEAFWQGIAASYTVEPGPINLENGYFGRMTDKVLAAYKDHIDYVNRSNSVYVRQQFDEHDSEQIRRQLAELMQVATEEIAITRCASESLQLVDPQLQRPATGRSGADLRPGLHQRAKCHALAGQKPRRGSDRNHPRPPGQP